MPHTVPADEEKPNRDCRLVQEIRGELLVICNDDAHLQIFVMCLTRYVIFNKFCPPNNLMK